MSVFAIEQGDGSAGTGSYEAGRLTMPDGTARGVETVARLTRREDAARRPTASQRLPGFLDTVRGVLPVPAGLSMPARLAVSTVRAGLGVIEEGLAPEGGEAVAVEIAFDDGRSFSARMPPGLLAVIRRDREIALGALARAGRSGAVPTPAVPIVEDTSEALTSIFRYEKRHGRLRRVAEPDPSAKE